MDKVAVLMSTYNGEKYLREQIDSILAQTGVEVTLIVRDDGSSDGTANILAEYADKYKNVKYELCENVGVGNSFLKLIYSAPDNFDYYALSDQDDIWRREKLVAAIEFLKKSNGMLYGSNQECVDKDGVSLGLRYAADEHIHLTPPEIMTQNMIAGCTMVFTREFYDILTEESHRPSAEILKLRIHDVWIAEVAALYGRLVYDRRSYIAYRQHENNFVGAFEKKQGFFKKTSKRLKKLLRPECGGERSEFAREICKKFPDRAELFPLLKICADSRTRKGKKSILKNGKELRSYSREKRLVFYIKVKRGSF